MSQDLTPFQPDGDGAAAAPVVGGDTLPAAAPPWQRYLSAVIRHKWIVLIVTLLGTAGGVFATRIVELTYAARTTLWMEVGDGADSGPITDGQLLQSTAWLELLRSATVLEHAVRAQRLYVSPVNNADIPLFSTLEVQETFRTGSFRLDIEAERDQFVLVDGQGGEIQRGRLGEPIGTTVGFVWSPPVSELRARKSVAFLVENPRDVTESLNTRLQTQMAEEGGSFLTITLEGTDAKRTTATLNEIAKRYVEVAAELKRAKLVELTKILNEQLVYAETSLKDAEAALEGFRVQTVTLPSEQASPVAAGLAMTQDPVFDNFFELKVSREQLREDREAIERVLREAEGSSAALDALNAIPAVAERTDLRQALELRTSKRADLRAMEQRYTAQWPPARQLRAEIESLERVMVPQMARELIASLASEERQAEQRITSASGELREIPSRSMEEASLERQVLIAEDLHTTLKQRYEVARLAAAGSVPDIRVLDLAVEPSAPTGDPRNLFILMGLLGSFGLAVVGSLVLDRMDPHVRYPEQLTHEMGLPIIGMVPHLKKVMNLGDAANLAIVSEAFREIRLSLLHAYGAAGPVMITVTSAEAGDGKSFVVGNLALAFSQQGYRTLVIDGDIRRGRLDTVLGAERSPGLTDFLSGRETQDDVIQATPHPNVSLIGSGTRMEIGPELLGSSGMASLTRGMRSRYDVILVDSPPLGAGVDPYVLGTVTGNLLMVFRTGNTRRSFAQAKLGLIDRLPIRLLGAVLNDIPANQKLYQHYSYIPGYRAENEDSTAWSLETAER